MSALCHAATLQIAWERSSSIMSPLTQTNNVISHNWSAGAKIIYWSICYKGNHCSIAYGGKQIVRRVVLCGHEAPQWGYNYLANSSNYQHQVWRQRMFRSLNLFSWYKSRWSHLSGPQHAPCDGYFYKKKWIAVMASHGEGNKIRKF